MQQALCDTSIFLALWAPGERTKHQLFSERFFSAAMQCRYGIIALDIVRDEIASKFSFLMENYYSLMHELFKLGKFKEFEIEKDREVQNIRKLAKQKGFDLSINDCEFLLVAKNKKLLLLSWDEDLINFSMTYDIEAKSPAELGL